MAQVIFPQQFSAVLQGQLHQAADGKTIAEVLQNLCSGKSGLKKLLFQDNGSLSPFLIFTLGGESKIYPASKAVTQSVSDSQTIEVIVGMAGG